MHIGFVIFDNKEYLDALGLQQLLWLHLEKIGHPAMKNLEINFASHVGEEIEEANRSLGQVVGSKKGQSNPEHLSTAYRRLGLMLQNNSTVIKDILVDHSKDGRAINDCDTI